MPVAWKTTVSFCQMAAAFLLLEASAFTTYAPVTLPETLTLPDADSSPVCAATNASYWVLALSADDHCAATSVTSLAASPVE